MKINNFKIFVTVTIWVFVTPKTEIVVSKWNALLLKESKLHEKKESERQYCIMRARALQFNVVLLVNYVAQVIGFHANWRLAFEKWGALSLCNAAVVWPLYTSQRPSPEIILLMITSFPSISIHKSPGDDALLIYLTWKFRVTYPIIYAIIF